MKQNGTAGNAPQPQFGLSAPTFNFDALIDGTRSTPFVYELDLSTARSFAAGTAVQIKITGNCLLIDSAPDVGNGYVIFEGVQDYTAGQVRAPIYAQPGFVTRLPFANVYVANAAQPGKKLRFIYGVDLDFQQMFPARMSVIEQGFDYSNTFASSTNLLAGTTETIVAPASNVNGVILHNATWSSNSAGAHWYTIAAKATPPVSQLDGDVLWGNYKSGLYMAFQTVNRSVRIRPGLGLYFSNFVNDETSCMRSAQVTIL